MAIKVLISHGNIQRLKQAVADLHSAGFDVVATPDGGDAFARFFEENPEIVICSIVLPSLAGPNIARMVRSQSPETAVVLLVESPDEVVEEGVLKIVEPLTLAALRDGLPDIAFDAPTPVTEEPQQEVAAASPQAVFFQAVLKRFQRDNRALQTLDDPGISRMAGLAANRNFGDSERIILQGDPGDGFYLLVEGQVKVTLAEKDDKEVARIAAGGFFGEMAMLKDQRRSASVWSIGQTTTLYFEKDTFLPFLNDYPAMREVLSGVALKRTEENLWRVLFDDDEVQRSIAQLGDSVLPEEDPAPAPRPRATAAASTAFTRTITPAAVLLTPEEAARQRPAVSWVRERSFALGLAAGLLGGVIGTLIIDAVRSRPPLVPAPALAVETSTSEAALPHAREDVSPFDDPLTVDFDGERRLETAGGPITDAPNDPSVKSAPAPVKTAVPEPSDAPAKTEPPAKAEPAPKSQPPMPDPNAPGAAERELLTEAYKAGNYKQVLQSARKLPAPLDGDVAFMVCDSQRHTGSPTALQAYLDFTRDYPAHHRADDAQFWAAELLMQQGKMADARPLYEKVAANEKSNFRNSAAKRLEK